ncbi:BON domain-containing protein [Azoarcus olearius]|uniref:Conserved hypothetical secreted protein n=1 Tax=Azoarcus sp. (strain BH72) TaxID=418699 RepID=A1K6B3_AZOSB|nr:BON domain-containing protein [Azoarcus olearius]ANQ84939.1 hypothetical protein dqs_1901 [Azoarcus olearius]CAL94368.1 conserved hypothetical secreted protein [Azoarcus olearius]
MKPTRIPLALACAATLVLAACGEPSGVERGVTTAAENGGSPLTVRADDAALKARVNAALAADEKVEAKAITVTVNRGEVKLDGVVPADQITRADAIARDISGVQVVINALRPAQPSS